MDAYTGQITMWSGQRIPVNWLACDGSKLSVSAYPALFALLGPTYGGDGVKDFALPDLRGRVPIGTGTLAPNSYALGQSGGVEYVTLTVDQIPAHTHAFNVLNTPATSATPVNMMAATVVDTARLYLDPSKLASGVTPATQVMNEAAVLPGGGYSQPHPNMMPTAVIRYIICVNGLFPQRAS